MEEDYYAVLGVPKEATPQDIKRAFRDIARKCHPDVSGGDPVLEERFKTARLAYETLSDQDLRAKYDRRAQRRASGGGAPQPGGTFFDAFWKASERAYHQPEPARRRATGRKNSGNDVSLDDLFDGWGRTDAAGGGRPANPGPRSWEPPPAPEPGGWSEPDPLPPRRDVMAEEPAPGPPPGRDVHVELELPYEIARDGGAVTTVYHRLQRVDPWRPGSPGAGVVRVQDIAEVRIVPGTRTGEVLRERGLGDAGAHGGGYGDLYCTVKVVGGPRHVVTPAPAPDRAAPPPRPAPERPPPAPAAGEEPADALLDISVVEALLGGRVSVETPQGKVRATIPPCTSSGVRMRLKGKGPAGADGLPTDWYVVTRIVVPATLDPESRRLVEEFARLNP
jgi:DnaJ-class molecular chaperone